MRGSDSHDIEPGVDIDGFTSDSACQFTHQKQAVSPTSRLSTFRLNGALDAWWSRISKNPETPRAARVLMGPAEIALTLTPLGPRSFAK